MTDSDTGRDAISEPGLPDGYREHLLERRDRVGAEVVPPSLSDLVADRGGAESGERSSSGRSRRPVRVLLAAAVVALIAGAGIMFATAQRDRPVRVNTASGDDTVDSADPLAGLPLLFPPAQTDKVGASMSTQKRYATSGVDVSGLADVTSETFVAGKVGEKAKLITVVSAPRWQSAEAFDLLRPVVPIAEWFGDSEPLSAKGLEDRILAEHREGSIRVTVNDLLDGTRNAESSALEVVVDELAGHRPELGYVLLRGESFDTIVVSSQVQADVIRRVVKNLVPDGGRLRVGEVPPGFERLGQRSFWRFASSGYVTGAPSRLGYEFPISVSVDGLRHAGGPIAFASAGMPDATVPLVVLETGPNWVLGNIDWSIAAGISDGAWVSVSDFTLRGFDKNYGGTWTTEDVSRLRGLWNGVREVDRATFDAALAREADWDTVQFAAPDPAATGGSTTTTTTTTTTLPGG